VDPEVSIADSYGFNARELASIVRIIMDNRDRILRAWDEHFGNRRSI
jgi:hypothetical protein